MQSTKYHNNNERFALIDCDSFFVSCEKLFNPQLYGKPVVVLSSNDACVIARSKEAKQLGIGMGQPFWECEQKLKRAGGVALSSNFSLYADISARVMQTIQTYAPECEIYSIDEAFIKLHQPYQAPAEFNTNFCLFLKRMIYRDVGIPVTIGIGPTKTLAKIAHSIAKKGSLGVFDITDTDHDAYLKTIPASEIWGIGRQHTRHLKKYLITTAFDFKNQQPDWVRSHFTVTGLRTHQELNGVSCLMLDELAETRKSLTVSRLFGRPITSLDELIEAGAAYSALAAEKLHNFNLCAQHISVLLVRQAYDDPERIYTMAHIPLPLATAYTPTISNAVATCVKQLYKPHYKYRKLGITLNDLCAPDQLQLTHVAPHPDAREQVIMSTIAKAHQVWGRDTLFFAAAGTERSWKMKQLKRTPHYTTNWHDLLTIKI